MEQYFKISGIVLIVCIICLLLDKKEKDIGLLLTVCTCCVCGFALLHFLEPVIRFVQSMEALSAMDPAILRVIFKVVAVGIIGQISDLICQDAGKAALGKLLQTCATGVILWLSLPLFTKILELVSQILGGL